jgi:hypothetical protein
MTPAQALRHCAIGLEAATGDSTLERSFASKLLGPLFKGWLLSAKPFSHNAPTHPQLVMSESCDFGAEKARLLAALARFHAAGPAAAARYQHAFVGRVTGDEWGRLQHKHLDHHLRQFGG